MTVDRQIPQDPVIGKWLDYSFVMLKDDINKIRLFNLKNPFLSYNCGVEGSFQEALAKEKFYSEYNDTESEQELLKNKALKRKHPVNFTKNGDEIDCNLLFETESEMDNGRNRVLRKKTRTEETNHLNYSSVQLHTSTTQQNDSSSATSIANNNFATFNPIIRSCLADQNAVLATGSSIPLGADDDIQIVFAPDEMEKIAEKEALPQTITTYPTSSYIVLDSSTSPDANCKLLGAF